MEYDISKIRSLCDRYFDGDTSEQEELTLRTYFNNVREIPEDLRAVKVMMGGFSEAAGMTYAPVRKKKTQGVVRRVFIGLTAAAASAAICISLFDKEAYGYDVYGNSITDPEVALESTVYLSYLSKLETTIDLAQMLAKEMENNN